MLIRGVPFNGIFKKENRIIYELYDEELERNDDSLEGRYKNFNNEKNTDSEYNKSDGEFKDTFKDDLIVEYREACNKLNVEYDDDIDTIKKQYKFLIKANHPDNHENNERAVKTLQSINVAYETIKKYRNFD